MFKGKESKVKQPAPETLFGRTEIPSIRESLTASYQSNDWKDGLRLTFFRLDGEAVVDTPFLPGLTTALASHDADE